MTTEARFNPFPGLRSFEPDEDHLFFGRETQVDDLLGRLRRTRFLAVVGGSGSGKSSLVKSGLIPSLCSGYMVKAGSSWRAALLRPGADPVSNLAAALNDPAVLGGDPASAALNGAMLDAALRRSGHGLIDAVVQARLPPGENLLVIVDQFEELFRFKQARAEAGGRDEAVGFVKLLLEAARQDDAPIYVVLTMRSEFIGSCAEFPGLAEAVNDGQYLVPRMTRDELRLAITGPVAVGGGAIASRLVTRMLNEVGDDPDQLPVLQHALMRTWDKWAADRAGRFPIDVDDYEAIGTMQHALSRHADQAYDEIATDRGRRLIEVVFKALTETTGQGLGLRRPCRVSELCEVGEASIDEVAAVVDRFRAAGRSFLVPPASVPLQLPTIVDLSHESLMRLWTRLARWTQEEARSTEMYRRLSDAALLHARNEAGLWRDPELQLTLNWRDLQHPTEAWARRHDDGFARATEFLTASQLARDASAAQEAAEAAERRTQEQKIRRRTYALFAISLLSIVLVAYGFYRARQAQAEAAAALFRADTAINLAIVVTEDFREKPAEIGATALMAIEALRLARSASSVRHTLIDILQLLPLRPTVPDDQPHSKRIQKMAVDRDGHLLVTAGEDGKVVLWDFAKHRVRRTLADNPADPAVRLAISWDGRFIAAAASEAVEIWEAETGTLLKQIPVNRAQSITFSPDRPVMVIAGIGGAGAERYFRDYDAAAPYREFSTSDWNEIALSDAPAAREAAFSPAGDLVLITAAGIRLASAPGEVANTQHCRSLQFAPSGDLVAICPEGVSSFTRAGDTLKPLKVIRGTPPNAASVSMNSVEGRNPEDLYLSFSDGALVSALKEDGSEYVRLPERITGIAVPVSGSWIASGNATGQVAFWQLARGLAPPPLAYKGQVYHGEIVDLTFSHDEAWLAIAEVGGAIRIFDTKTGEMVHTIDLPAGPLLPRFSPDDSLLIVPYANDLRVIRTPDAGPGESGEPEWSMVDDLKPQHADDRISFTFSLDSQMLMVAEGQLVQRFRVSDDRHALTALPPIVVTTGTADVNAPSHREPRLFVSADGQWIAGVDDAAAPAAGTNAWNAETGLPATPDAVRNLHIDGTTDLGVPDWIPLRPANDAALSGDADGGDWWTADLELLNAPSPFLRILERQKPHHVVAELEHPSDVKSLAVSHHGNWIAAVTRDDVGSVFIWPWSQQGLVELACRLVPGSLTEEEWDDRSLGERGLGAYRPTCSADSPAP